jgi:hypothetical protein
MIVLYGLLQSFNLLFFHLAFFLSFAIPTLEIYWMLEGNFVLVLVFSTIILKYCWHNSKLVSFCSSPIQVWMAVSNFGSQMPARKSVTFLVPTTDSSKNNNSLCACWYWSKETFPFPVKSAVATIA